MSELKIFLLGSTRIERNGVAMAVDTRKAIALLAYLIVTGQRHSRDALAALLWPDSDQSSARGALRRTLSALNKALGSEGLDIDRETVGLNGGATIWSDVGQFQRLLIAGHAHARTSDETCMGDREPLAAAVALYRDDFMAGFSLRDSPAFDDWQFFQAEHLRRELSGALERLIHCHTLLGASIAPLTMRAAGWRSIRFTSRPIGS